MRFQRQEDIAILFMSELARSTGGTVVPLSHVARLHGVSLLFLKKIVRQLRQADLVTAREGIAGGYALVGNPRTISVWDIVRALGIRKHDGKEEGLPKSCPLYSRCLPQRVRQQITSALQSCLGSLSLFDITQKDL